MNSIQDCITMANGVQIPCVGFGTWKTPAEQTVESVLAAIKAGYRHIDTARAYGNEKAVGQALIQSGVSRKEMFITTKLWNAHQGYESTLKAFDKSLAALQSEYVDLYLIHWPQDSNFFDNWQEMNQETWRAFEELYQAGKVRAIGFSNFRPHHIENILKHAQIKPMVNQIEFHPGMDQSETREYCREHQIVMEGWSPLGSGSVFNSAEMQRIAEKYQKSIAQICLRWAVQNDVIPLPKSVTPERIQENAQIFDFQIEEEDMKKIAEVDCGFSGLDPDHLTY